MIDSAAGGSGGVLLLSKLSFSLACTDLQFDGKSQQTGWIKPRHRQTVVVRQRLHVIDLTRCSLFAVRLLLMLDLVVEEWWLVVVEMKPWSEGASSSSSYSFCICRMHSSASLPHTVAGWSRSSVDAVVVSLEPERSLVHSASRLVGKHENNVSAKIDQFYLNSIHPIKRY